MTDYTRTIARIESTWLGYEDHGLFSLNISFTFGASAQGTGHYMICSSDSDRPDDAIGVRFIKAIIDACGVSRWEDLPGREVYVLHAEAGYHAPIVGIEPLPINQGKRVVFADIFEAAT